MGHPPLLPSPSCPIIRPPSQHAALQVASLKPRKIPCFPPAPPLEMEVGVFLTLFIQVLCNSANVSQPSRAEPCGHWSAPPPPGLGTAGRCRSSPVEPALPAALPAALPLALPAALPTALPTTLALALPAALPAGVSPLLMPRYMFNAKSSVRLGLAYLACSSLHLALRGRAVLFAGN